MVVTESLPVVEIGIVILVSLVSGILFSRLGQSSSLGYIVAGLLLGPLGLHVLGGSGTTVTSLFGEIGVTMLLFYLGLELSIRRFKETGAIATVLAFVEMAAAFAAGVVVAKAFGFTDLEALIIGSMLTATSTVITGKFLIEKGLIQQPESRVTISVLILEDFFAILVLVLVASLSAHQSTNLLVLNALVFVVAMFFIVSKVSKHVLNILSSIGRQDQMWLYGIGVFLVVSFFGSTYLGLTTAIGAYFAGFALAESTYGDRIKRELGLFREFFVLFFFVSFGATTTLPSDPRLFLLLIALAIAYVFSKLVAHGITGTAIGMDLKTAITGGILMSPVGEFAIIIALAAAPLLPDAQDIRSVAFLLAIITPALLPILYDRREAVTKAFQRVFPLKLQAESRVLQHQMKGLDKLVKDTTLQSTTARSLSKLFTHLVIAVCIVYLSYLTQAEFALPFLAFLPPGLSPGLLILPLIVWPIYKFIAELKFLTRKAANKLFQHTFMDAAGIHMGSAAADVFTGIVLTLLGLGSTLALYYGFAGNYVVLVVPATYTLLAVMYLSKSFYGLIEQYELMETLLGIERLPPKQRKVAELSQEFNEHARYFQRLHAERQDAKERILDALEAERLEDAKTHLIRFKRRETKALVNLFDFSSLKQWPRMHALVKSGIDKNERFHGGIRDVRTRAAFESYLSTHLKPHLFEPSSTRVEAAAQELIRRDLKKQAPGSVPVQEKAEATALTVPKTPKKRPQKKTMPAKTAAPAKKPAKKK